MGSPLVADESVNLVDDDGPDRPEEFSAPLAREQDVEGFRRRDHDVWRTRRHPRAVSTVGVTAPDHRPDVDARQAKRLEFGRDSSEWRLQIPLDVVAERLERRHVDDPRLVRQRVVHAVANELIDRREERREGLAGPGGSGDERIFAGDDVRPPVLLGRGRRPDVRFEPAANGWMKRRERLRRGGRFVHFEHFRCNAPESSSASTPPSSPMDQRGTELREPAEGGGGSGCEAKPREAKTLPSLLAQGTPVAAGPAGALG